MDGIMNGLAKGYLKRGLSRYAYISIFIEQQTANSHEQTRRFN